MQYRPEPRDTSNVMLPEGVVELTEILAKNTHENWAVARISEGWSYGVYPNDEKKQTPCLVRYEDLPEEEKQYDRTTALEALKLICMLGYDIVKRR